MSKRRREDGYAWISPLCSCGVTERDHANADDCPGFNFSGEWYSDETGQTLIVKEDESTFPRRLKTVEAQNKNILLRIEYLESMSKELDLRTFPMMKAGGTL